MTKTNRLSSMMAVGVLAMASSACNPAGGNGGSKGEGSTEIAGNVAELSGSKSKVDPKKFQYWVFLKCGDKEVDIYQNREGKQFMPIQDFMSVIDSDSLTAADKKLSLSKFRITPATCGLGSVYEKTWTCSDGDGTDSKFLIEVKFSAKDLLNPSQLLGYKKGTPLPQCAGDISGLLPKLPYTPPTPKP